MSQSNYIEGGCFCGAIRYRVPAGDYLVANCHCSVCRRTSAAPFVTWFVVPRQALEYTQGTPRELRSSEVGRRYLCERCGTPIAFQSAKRPRDVDVTACSLDQPERFVPSIAVHEDTKLSWLGATEHN